MNLRKNLGLAASLALVLGFGSPAMAQDGGAPPLFKPLPEHKVLAADAGTWEATVKTFDGGPDAEPKVSTGSEVNSMLPGGLWSVSEFKGDFGGVAFVGRGQFGYDPFKKKYVGSWIDSFVPNLMTLEGSYDAKTKTMTYEGEGVEPVTKAKYIQKMVTVTKDDGSRHFTLLMKSPASGDREIKILEIIYKRKTS